MNKASDTSQLEAEISNDFLVPELYKELIKGTISFPIEGCKSMATGCATVAALYGATLVFANAGKLPDPTHWKTYVLLAPFVLFAMAGFFYGTGFLPRVRLPELLQLPASMELERQQAQLLAREEHIRTHLLRGSVTFWCGLLWAFVAVIVVRVP